MGISFPDSGMPVTGSTKRNKPPYLIGVAGGSGSGKTTFARALQERLGAGLCELIYQDNFYFDQSARFDRDGGSVNFDHPDSIDFGSLAKALASLRNGFQTNIPIYDFVSHSRKKQTFSVAPKPIIVVDGILILHSEAVRKLFDERLFFDAPESLRYSRRLERDVRERGRSPDGVRIQFESQVKPMHDLYVEPSKTHADAVINDSSGFQALLSAIASRFGS